MHVRPAEGVAPITPTSKTAARPLLHILVGAAALLTTLAAYLFAASALQPLALAAFFEIYLGVFVAAALGLAGVVLLLIGVIAAGVRLGMRSDSGTP